MIPTAGASREEVYGALAALLVRPPSEDMLRAIAEDGDVPFDADAVACDFAELFRGLRWGGPRPPYESLYREGALLGRCTEDVQRMYRQFGLRASTAVHGEPEDHIALELDFMRHLCALERRVDPTNGELRQVLEAQRRFITDHLAVWTPELLREVQGADASGFYSGVLSFASCWLDEDLRRLEERLGSREVGA